MRPRSHTHYTRASLTAAYSDAPIMPQASAAAVTKGRYGRQHRPSNCSRRISVGAGVLRASNRSRAVSCSVPKVTAALVGLGVVPRFGSMLSHMMNTCRSKLLLVSLPPPTTLSTQHKYAPPHKTDLLPWSLRNSPPPTPRVSRACGRRCSPLRWRGRRESRTTPPLWCADTPTLRAE